MSHVAPSANAGLNVPRRSSSRYALYVFWVMFSINLLNYLDRYLFIGASNRVAKELGFGLDGVGYLTSAFLIVYTLGTIPLGIWADRTNRKDVVAVCVAVWSAATALTALANNFVTLFLSRMVLGIGEAGYFPAGTALMSDYFNREKRSRIMSWWSTGQYIGLMIGFVIGGLVTKASLPSGTWRYAFLIVGIPGLIVAFIAWRLREPRRNQADEESFALEEQVLSSEVAAPEPSHAVPTNVLSQFGALMRIKTLVVLIVMQVFAFFVLGVNVTFLPIYLQQKDTLNFSSDSAGTFSGAVIVLAGIVGVVIGGYLADILNRRHPGARVLVCGIGFLLSAPAFAFAITSRELTVFTIFFVITVILLSIYNGPSTAATQDVVPSSLRASAVAVSLLLAHLFGDAFAPSLVGFLATSFDPTHGQHFAQSVAGHDLTIALLITCTPCLILAGLVGIFGAGWMKDDVMAAEQADKMAKGNNS
jgi:MFS family permease